MMTNIRCWRFRIPGWWILGSLALVPLNTGALTTNVVVSNYSFTPKTVHIHVGDTVVFTNALGFHTVTGDGADPFCGSGTLSGTCSDTFDTAGTFAYHCIYHAALLGMTGAVVVLPAENLPPTVSLSGPTNGSVFIAPADIPLAATAVDTGDIVAKVEFFSGTQLLGTVTNAPFSLTWSNVPLGTYTLTATATDSHGATSNSLPVTVSVAPVAAFQQHNLVSDLPGLADHTDTNLLNPWGIAFNPAGPFWISDNHAGVSTIYNSTGAIQSLIVTIPPPAGGSPPSAPDGIVFNNTPDFIVETNKALFIFATEDGTISAWSSGPNAVLKADQSASNAIYKGLALGASGGSNYLYAADFHNGKIDVFDAAFHLTTLPGSFTDPTLPAGYAPFGIENVNGSLFVTYALQDDQAEDDVAGPGHGFVNVFDTAGNWIKRFVSNGALNSPWGITLAPPGFGQWSGDLLIGNFGDGHINVFNRDTGEWKGLLSRPDNTPVAVDGLWALKFGNGARGGDAVKLYFTAGIAGGGSLEDHGLFGSFAAVPSVLIGAVRAEAGSLTINWSGGTPPYRVQVKTDLTDLNWTDLPSTTNTTLSLPTDGSAGFVQVLDQTATNGALLRASGPAPAP